MVADEEFVLSEVELNTIHRFLLALGAKDAYLGIQHHLALLANNDVHAKAIEDAREKLFEACGVYTDPFCPQDVIYAAPAFALLVAHARRINTVGGVALPLNMLPSQPLVEKIFDAWAANIRHRGASQS